MDEHGHASPWCRATIAGGTITLNPWTPALIRGGPAGMALAPLRERGIALADLTAEGEPYEEELFVRYVRQTRTPEADATLLAWAQTVGYLRVWLPDRVVALDRVSAELGVAEVSCRTCGLTWQDDGPDFWQCVRGAGAFPAFCLACGSSLPEWSVVAGGCPTAGASASSGAESAADVPGQGLG